MSIQGKNTTEKKSIIYSKTEKSIIVSMLSWLLILIWSSANIVFFRMSVGNEFVYMWAREGSKGGKEITA